MIILIILFSLSATEATYCALPAEDTLYIYPTPKNCSSFIACINYEEHEFDCIEAEIFLPWANGTICMEACETITTRRSLAKSKSGLQPDPLLFPDSPQMTIICPPTGETSAVVTHSCTEFLSCNDGTGTKQSCALGMEFSPTLYECVPKKMSDCPKQKQKGSYELECRFDKGTNPIYFPSQSCPEFKKCSNKLAWDVKCAKNCNWNNQQQTCDWADNFECPLPK